MTKPRNNPLKVKSMNSEAVEDAKIITETPKPTPLPKIEAQTEKVISPMLSDSIDVMEHAIGETPVSPQPQAHNTSQSDFKVSGDLFPPSQVNAAPASNVNGTPSPNPGFSIPDAPEQTFVPAAPNGSSSSGPAADAPIPDAIQTSAKGMADTVTDMYKSLVPEVTHWKTRISDADLKNIKQLEKSGDVLPGLSNDLAEHNNENKTKLVQRAKKDADMLKGPLERSLAKFFAEKKIEASPYHELIMVVIAIIVTQFFLIREINQSNKNLLSKIYEKIDSFKKPESDIPLAQTEEVKA